MTGLRAVLLPISKANFSFCDPCLGIRDLAINKIRKKALNFCCQARPENRPIAIRKAIAKSGLEQQRLASKEQAERVSFFSKALN